MDVQAQIAADLRLRSDALAQEIAAWQHIASGNVAGMGIHDSQVRAIALLFDELQAKQQRVRAAVRADLAPAAFAAARRQAESTLAGTHSLVAVFRMILDQRQDAPSPGTGVPPKAVYGSALTPAPLPGAGVPPKAVYGSAPTAPGSQSYRVLLDAADLIAADCYLPCIDNAICWEALPAGCRRVPPLTFFNAHLAPEAYTRRHAFGAFGLATSGYADLKLPISVIGIPFSYGPTLWALCSLYHEVGHLLDQDLGLSGALSAPLAHALAGRAVPPERVDAWSKLWLREVLADACGALLGGPAFVLAMRSLLWLAENEVMLAPAGDPHPPHYLRVPLLAALLSASGRAELVAVAGEVESAWRERYPHPPDALAAYAADCPWLAQALVAARPLALKTHGLAELFPGFPADAARAHALAQRLQGEEHPEADVRGLSERLLPAAAQLALESLPSGLAADERVARSADIQARALAVRAAIPHPERMAGQAFSVDQDRYLRGLVRALDFDAI